MIPIGYKVFSVVAGGVLMGTLGSTWIEPVPKEPEQQWWQLTGRVDVAPSTGSGIWVEAGPDDLYVPRQDGYAPDWADDGEVWTYRLPDIPEWEPEPFEPATEVAVAEEPAEPAEDQTYRIVQFPSEPEPGGAAAPEPGPAPGDARKSELAVAGLY